MHKQNIFFLKADTEASDNLLQNLPQYHLNKKNDLEKTALEYSMAMFGSAPEKIEYFGGKGTFHLIFILHYNDRKILIKCKIDMPESSEDDFKKQFLLHQLLIDNNISVPEVYHSSTFSCSYNYCLAMQFIEGRLLDHIVANSNNVCSTYVTEIGRYMYNLHKIDSHGYGLLSINNNIGAKISGLMSSWHDYIGLRLDEHIKVCLDNGYITRREKDIFISVFREVDSTLKCDNPRILHGDLSSKNIIISNCNNMHVIDWEDSLSGDPVFDIAMWNSFIIFSPYIDSFLEGYYSTEKIPSNFFIKLHFYKYRILLAKTVHRFRFQSCKNDRIYAGDRLSKELSQLLTVIS